MSCPGQASEHDADHGQSDEGSDGAGVALEIACQAAIAADPGQGSFDLAPTPTALSRRYRRFDQRPLAVAQITRVAQAMAVGRTAVFRLPHSAPLSSDAGAREGITTDSSDSTTLWIGS